MPLQCYSRSAGHPINVWGRKEKRREERKRGREEQAKGRVKKLDSKEHIEKGYIFIKYDN